MAPPVTKHQEILMALLMILGNFVRGKSYKVFPAPFGVRLKPKNDLSDSILLEPDIAVICDLSKLDEQGCNGAPDMIIEILSPSTASKDRVLKFRKYCEAGVREYWIIDPESNSVQTCVLENGRYVVSVFEKHETAPVTILPGLEVNLSDIF